MPRGLKVLVVEDYRDAAESLAALLELWGHEPTMVQTAEEARASFRTMRPHVVLLDLALPDGDGCELVGALRALPGGKEALVVAVTGYGDERHRSRSREAGCDEYLLRPVDQERLAAFLDQAAAARHG